MITRRGFLQLAGAVAVAALGMGCVEEKPTETPTPAPAVTPLEIPELPWTYEKLDVEKTRKLGHLGYCKGLHCAAGAFYAIVGQLQENVGFPWTQIPIEMYHYGAGGVAGWATLCGALNSACGAINLATGEDHKKLVNELVGWYTIAKFPSDESNEYAVNHEFLVEEYKSDKELVQTVSASPLCHESVTRWCEASGYASGSAERSERCARLTGDVAAKAVELLNAWKDGTFEPQFEFSEETSGCRGCHFKGKDFNAGQFTRGKVECLNCHVSHPVPPESTRIRSILNQTSP